MSACLAWTLRQTHAAFAYRHSGCSMSATALENDLRTAMVAGSRDEICQIVPLLRGSRWIERMALRREYARINNERRAA